MATSNSLNIVSYLAPNWFWFYEAVSAAFGRALGTEVQIVQAGTDPLEDPSLLSDRLDVAFLCGLPFSRYCQVVPDQLHAIAAPVMQAPRYRHQPIYFADVVVRADSTYAKLADLAGSTFCYNDAGSNSGYNLLLHHLQQAGYNGFFAQAVQSGSHQRSLRWVAEGVVDCAAIDSTVLERELLTEPGLSAQVRVLESIGPASMPPVVAARHLGKATIEGLRAALLHPDPMLQAAMQQATIECYAGVHAADYRPLAELYAAVMQAGLVASTTPG